MKLAEYAVDKSLRTHRILSALVCLTLVAVAYTEFGLDGARRAVLLFGLATAGIWFSEAWILEKPSDRHYAPAYPKSAKGIRLVCWCVLLGVPLFIYLFPSSK